MNEKITIDEAFIQETANNLVDSEQRSHGLTSKEVEEVFYAFIDNVGSLLEEKILEVVEFNEMLARNKDAYKVYPHYKVYWRNENAYQNLFKDLGTFGSEIDAKMLVHRDFISEFDEWKVVLITQSNEQTVYQINIKNL